MRITRSILKRSEALNLFFQRRSRVCHFGSGSTSPVRGVNFLGARVASLISSQRPPKVARTFLSELQGETATAEPARKPRPHCVVREPLHR